MTIRRRTLQIAILVVVVAAGYLGARAVLSGRPSHLAPTASNGRGVTPRVSRASATAAGGRTSSVTESFADRAPQPVAAAVLYLQLVSDGAEPADAATALRSVTRGRLTNQAEQALAASQALKRRLLASSRAFARGWSLGWRLLVSRTTTATVAIWTMGIVASRHVVLAPSFSTTVCVERRAEDRWVIVSADTQPGPTPPTDGSDPAAVTTFARAAGRFVAFGHAS